MFWSVILAKVYSKNIKYKTAQQIREKIIYIQMTKKNTEND